MTFKLTYYYNGIFPLFELNGIITINELNDVLRILEELLDKKEPFAFVLDGREITEFPTFKSGYYILSWMRRNYKKIPDVLLASAIITNNETILNILDWVFKQKKPINPNLITKDKEEGMEFIKKYIKCVK